MKTTKTNKVNKVSNATKKARAKKQRQTPQSLIIKREIKVNFEEKVLSINGLIKFAKGRDKGLSQTNKLINYTNDKLKLENPIKLEDISVASVLENLSDKEKFVSRAGKLTEEKRTKFSLHHINLAIGRIAKARKQQQTKKVVKKTIKVAKKVA
jgi:hypothetical protein